MLHYLDNNTIIKILKISVVAFVIIAFTPAYRRLIAEESPAKLKIVCTTNILTATVKEISGDSVEVKGLMGEGIDPHLYRPAPGDVRMLMEADLIIYNGLHLEGRMADILENLSRKKKTAGVGERLDKSLLREAREFPGSYDPHIWFDVSNWLKIAGFITDELIKIDPKNESKYTASFNLLKERYNKLESKVRSEIESIPKANRLLVTAHDAFGYFGRAYGIEVKGIQGLSTDSETSLLGMNKLVDELVERKVPAIFVESSIPQKAVEALIEMSRDKGHTLKVGGELYSDALGADGTYEGTYPGMIEHNLKTIVNGLKGLS